MKNRALTVKQIDLHRWFPPDDKVAAAVARLCVLREDFYLEGLGFGIESLPDLDSNGEVWRRLYFLRQSVKTLLEAKSAIMRLKQDTDFQAAVAKEEPSFQKAIRDFEVAVEKADIKDIRNALGGHVLEGQVATLLNRLDSTDEGIAIFGSTHCDTHYKFAAKLILGIMLNEIPKEDETKRLEEITGTILADLMGAVDTIFTVYATSRHLI